MMTMFAGTDSRQIACENRFSHARWESRGVVTVNVVTPPRPATPRKTALRHGGFVTVRAPEAPGCAIIRDREVPYAHRSDQGAR
jgi:hypothetical protein